MSDSLRSVILPIEPCDANCRYWAKVIRAGQLTPMPVEVRSSRDVPGDFVPVTSRVELFYGDFLLEGEETEAGNPRAGWTYTLTTLDEYGDQVGLDTGDQVREKIKALALDVPPGITTEHARALLSGIGDIADMVMTIHYWRFVGGVK